MFDAIDVNGSGDLQYDEFLAALDVEIVGRDGFTRVDGWKSVIIEHVRTVFSLYSSPMSD